MDSAASEKSIIALDGWLQSPAGAYVRAWEQACLDELTVDIVRGALEARGHVVGRLNDGKPVCEVVELKRPDVVILNVESRNNDLSSIRDIVRCGSEDADAAIICMTPNGRIDGNASHQLYPPVLWWVKCNPRFTSTAPACHSPSSSARASWLAKISS